MLDVMEIIEVELPLLLESSDDWRTLYINYHPPFVERVFRRWGDYRVYLHRIHPCDSDQALFHPHPWPSAMHIFSGVYEMAIGYGPGTQPPPYAARLVASGDLKYEMTEPDAWHYVRPIGGVAMTLMITGPPWERWSPGRTEQLSPLDDSARDEILSFFRRRFPK